jgi:predicted flap endonuclease-1-like 5' DNA nuclease
MFYKITEIEGIAAEYVRKLEKAGITTTEHLLAKARDSRARESLALRTGIGEKHLARWAAMADLMRVKGIGRQYSELLLAVGVDSTEKLTTFNPGDLVRLMQDQKKAKKLAGGVPKLTDVEQWQDELRSSVFAHAK